MARAISCLLAALFFMCSGAGAQTQAQEETRAREPARLSLLDFANRPVAFPALADRPTVLVFADFTCRTLCGPVVSFVGHALDQTELQPGRDFKLAVVSLDPKDDADDARRMLDAHLGQTPLRAKTTVLHGNQTAIAAFAKQFGYRYRYEASIDQFVHPATVFVLSAGGQVSRELSGIGLDGPTMRLALIEAGRGKVGTFRDQVHLLCTSFDPARGTYNLMVSRVLAASSAVTLSALGLLIGVLLLWPSRKRG